jgi:hypothetical protein
MNMAQNVRMKISCTQSLLGKPNDKKSEEFKEFRRIKQKFSS